MVRTLERTKEKVNMSEKRSLGKEAEISTLGGPRRAHNKLKAGVSAKPRSQAK